MQRMLEALEDLERAAAIAGRLGERARVAELLLEQATVLDWMERFADSAARAAEARPIALATGDPRLRARLAMAEGRACWRREEIGPAIEALERAVAAAAAAGDVETEIIALLLLPLPLLFAGDRDRAATLFARGIELAESAGDRLHVCVALTNRMFLWRDDPGRAVADLRRANQLARELGQAAIERVATHNLAEILYWSGEDAEARDLAERGLELKVRFVPEPVADDGLLLARICIASGDLERAREILAALRAEVPDERLAPSDRVLLEGLERSVGVATAAPWHELRRRARADLGPEEAVEVAYLSALDACRRNDPVAAREALNEANSGEIKAWRTRLRSLEDALDHLLRQINM
jgi:tetratricopeptide (TPR) repeat protein